MKKQPSIILALILSIAICCLPSVANGMPTLSAQVDGRDGHRSEASGDRLRRQMDYSEDETVVVEAPPDAYASSNDELADGNLTLRFGYGGYQQPAPQQYNPYGGWNPYGGGQQPFPGYQPPQTVPNYYNNYPGGYPAAPYGPYNYNYPDYSSNSTTTINPFYNNYGYNYYYPMMNTTTTTTTTTARPTSTSTTTRAYGNYYVFNFRDGSNQTDIDDGGYNGGAAGQDDGFNFGNR